MAMLHNLAAGDDPDLEDPADDEHAPFCLCDVCTEINPDDDDDEAGE
jgi:hypothetical protein